MPVQGSPSSLTAGMTVRNPILEDYVFQSGIHKPEHSSLLTYKYPMYYMTSLLDRIGANESVAADVYSWNILDRTREGGGVNDISTGANGISTTTLTFDTDITYGSPNLGYLIVGDVIRFMTGALGKVTAVAAGNGSATDQNVVVESIGGFTWTADSVVGTGVGSTTTGVWGHAFNAFEEASSAPNGRLFLPDEDYNYLQILRRSFAISGTEFTNRTYLKDGKSWYFEVEDIHMKEFARDREIMAMFGVRSSSGTTNTTGGIYEDVLSEGVNKGFASSAGVTETDIQDMLQDLMVEGGSSELTVLCGAQFLADAQRALRDYAVNGAIGYGSFGGNTAGLDFSSYKFLGKTINLVFYELFNDVKVLPYVGTPSSSETDFSNFSLWLDMGADGSGNQLIKMRYKELNGQSRKFIHKYVEGMMGPNGSNGGSAANGDDKFAIHYLSDIGMEIRLANRMGILKAVS